LRSGGTAGDGVLEVKGEEHDARGKSGGERVKITGQVRQLKGCTLGAVQAQVTKQSLHAKVSDPRMEVKKKKDFHSTVGCSAIILHLDRFGVGNTTKPGRYLPQLFSLRSANKTEKG